LRRGDHLTLLHEEAHHVGRGAVQLGAQLDRGRGPLDHDGALGHRRVGRGVDRHVDRLQLLAAATTTTLAPAGRSLLRAATTTAGAATGTAATGATGRGPGTGHRLAGTTHGRA